MTASVLAGCQNYSTNELLDGNFGTEDFTPVNLLSPVNNSISSKEPKFTWTKRNGAQQYRLEVSSQSDYSAIVLRKTLTQTAYNLVTSDLIGIGQLEPITYYWRITTIYAGQQIKTPSAIFHLPDDTAVYVDANSTAATQVGNKTSPYKTIQAAIENAHLLRKQVTTVAMTIMVAKGAYVDAVSLKQGISLKGGYEAGGWTRNIQVNTTTIIGAVDSAIRGDASITSTTLIDGFTIIGGNAPSNAGISLSDASPTITNNTISGGKGTNSYGITNGGAATPIIMNNTIRGGSGSTASSGIYNTGGGPTITNNTIDGGNGNYTIGLHTRNGSTPIITNNIIFGGNGNTSQAIDSYLNGTPVISNNILHSGSGTTAHGVTGNAGGANPTLTNNILILAGNTRYGFREEDTGGDARSLENNAIWDSYNSGTLILFRNENSTNLSTLVSIELLTDWAAGADKARGNILLPTGAAGNPFVNVPVFWDRTSTANTGSASVILIADGNCARYINSEYIEWNGDGVARQISCNAAANPDEITLTPALSDSTKNLAHMEIRYWGSKSLGGTQYTIDYHLQQNSLSTQDWNNIRYGGKDTSGNNCGGAGTTGAGTQNCGAVTLDWDSLTRTTTNAGSANNNTVPNASGGATAAVPGGYSMGPYEKD